MGGVQLQVPKTVQLRVNTDLISLDDVLAWFDQLYQPEICEDFWLQTKLALTEGFTNAVRHAHKNKSPDVPIDIEIALLPEQIEIRIWDQGDPFDLGKWLQNPPPLDLYALGGRGIKLMQDTTDQISYARTPDNRNCLLLIKNYGGDRGLSHKSIARCS
jgi:serine/threonine-protein kinase RsbW